MPKYNNDDWADKIEPYTAALALSGDVIGLGTAATGVGVPIGAAIAGIANVPNLLIDGYQAARDWYNTINIDSSNWKSAASGITDLLSSANLIAQMIIEGDEFDGTYKSGKFAGENKLKVYITCRIPIYRGIKSSFIDIKDNNKFYKLTSNTLGFINSDNIVE